jgi:predicted transcriptional regulator
MARKNLSTRIDNDLQKSIKILAINLEKPLNDLLEEAIQDLLKKYQNPKSQKK